jgi:protein-disulfide isomerase
MNSKQIACAVLMAFIAMSTAFGQNKDNKPSQTRSLANEAQSGDRLVRPYSPTLGPKNAPVTIVEFFDPACEGCRAFYPIVKDLMRKYPKDVRLVLRYATFHKGSDQMVKFLEASKLQGKYWEVLEAVLAAQPQWASHSNPNISLAYEAAAKTGLDVPRALADAKSADMQAVLDQDFKDLNALEIASTPSFFVNGRPPFRLSPTNLVALVADEVDKYKK